MQLPPEIQYTSTKNTLNLFSESGKDITYYLKKLGNQLFGDVDFQIYCSGEYLIFNRNGKEIKFDL